MLLVHHFLGFTLKLGNFFLGCCFVDPFFKAKQFKILQLLVETCKLLKVFSTINLPKELCSIVLNCSLSIIPPTKAIFCPDMKMGIFPKMSIFHFLLFVCFI